MVDSMLMGIVMKTDSVSESMAVYAGTGIDYEYRFAEHEHEHEHEHE